MNSELTQTQIEDMTAEEIGQSIRDFIREAFAVLNDRREKEHAAGCAPLDAELETLAGELAEIEAESTAVLERMASASRVMQFEYDQLIMQGLNVQAQAKLEELQEVKKAPAQIEERRREIAERAEQIESEKKTALRRVAVDFRDASIELVRGAETGLARLLDGTRDSLNNLETMTGSVIYQPSMLTADEKSKEWFTLNRLYSGRVR